METASTPKTNVQDELYLKARERISASPLGRAHTRPAGESESPVEKILEAE